MYKIITLSVFLLCSTLLTAQVGIGTTNPAAGAMLDINSDNSGIVIPRVALTATNSQAPITAPSPEIGLMVFNTATAGTAPNNVTPGFYFWNGSGWVRLASGASTDWALTGNAGTTPGTNFIGTTDAQPLRIRTNNTEQFEITTDGRLRANNSGTQATPAYSFDQNTNMGMYRANANDLRFATGGNGRFQITNTFLRSFHNHRFANGTAAAPAITFENSQSTGLFRPDENILGFSTNSNERMRIIANGRVGINSNNPLGFVHVRSPLTGDPPAGGPGIYSEITVTNSAWSAIETFNPNTINGAGTTGTGFLGIRGNTTNLPLGWAGFFNGDVISRDKWVDRDIIALWGVSELSDTNTDDLTVFGIFANPSDMRIKSNVQSIDNGLRIINSLFPRKYEKNSGLVIRGNEILKKLNVDNSDLNNFNSNDILKNINNENIKNSQSTPIIEFGFIAQELEKILPDLVIEKRMNVEGFGEIDLKSVNYIGLIPILTQAIQEQQEIIESQEERIAKLEALVNQLINKK